MVLPAEDVTQKHDPWYRHIPVHHLVAGVTAGTVSTLILHPLDLIKIRFAVSTGRGASPSYRGLTDATKTIFATEGTRGLYQGAVPNVLHAGTAWGLYFFFYNALKHYIILRRTDVSGPLPAQWHLFCAFNAGLLTTTVTNPLTVVKTRICIQQRQMFTDDPTLRLVRYNGTFDAFKKVFTHEGVRGFYKGWVPGLFGVLHSTIQFLSYEELKKKYFAYHALPHTAELGTSEYLACATVSKLLAASLTYPYHVLRARLQDQRCQYTSLTDVIRSTWQFEGARGFYKGSVPYLFHVMPSICIIFITYEKVSFFLSHRWPVTAAVGSNAPLLQPAEGEKGAVKFTVADEQSPPVERDD